MNFICQYIKELFINSNTYLHLNPVIYTLLNYDKKIKNYYLIENNNITKYHIELLLKIFQQFLHNNETIRKSIALEINNLCTEFENIELTKKN